MVIRATFVLIYANKPCIIFGLFLVSWIILETVGPAGVPLKK
jgi:hypothetical protein